MSLKWVVLLLVLSGGALTASLAGVIPSEPLKFLSTAVFGAALSQVFTYLNRQAEWRREDAKEAHREEQEAERAKAAEERRRRDGLLAFFDGLLDDIATHTFHSDQIYRASDRDVLLARLDGLSVCLARRAKEHASLFPSASSARSDIERCGYEARNAASLVRQAPTQEEIDERKSRGQSRADQDPYYRKGLHTLVALRGSVEELSKWAEEERPRHTSR